MATKRASRGARRNLRLAASLVVGVLVALGLGGLGDAGVAALAGWSAGVATYCVWTWARVWGLDADGTRAHAEQEDPGRAVADILLLLAALSSVAGVGIVLLASQGSGLLAAGAGALAVVSSWALVHTVYGVRYADLYFASDEPPIDFGPDQPVYSDFAYLSFCLGMTYQISDTNLRTSALRRVVLWHTLLSYFLGAVVLACTINLVSGLVGG